MHILDLYLKNSSGKRCRIPAYSWRWWLFTVGGAILGAAGLYLYTVLLALACGY